MYWYVTLVERLPDGTTRIQGDLTVWAYSQAEAISTAEAMVSGHPFDVRASGARLASQGAGASGGVTG